MGILDNFEKGLERAVNGAFAKTFRSGIQPVELTSALRKELDTRAAVVTRDRILAPNRFRIMLASADYDRMRSIGPALIDELTQFVAAHAKQQHYQFAGGISVQLEEDEALAVGMLDIDSENVKSDVSWAPVLDVGSKRHPLTTSRTVVGRGSEADITVDDTGISRRHFQILWDGQHAQIEDLDSTNGTLVDGQRVGRAVLQPESIVKAGRTSMVFRVLPQSTSVQPYETHREENVTRVNDLRGLEELFGGAAAAPAARATPELRATPEPRSAAPAAYAPPAPQQPIDDPFPPRPAEPAQAPSLESLFAPDEPPQSSQETRPRPAVQPQQAYADQRYDAAQNPQTREPQRRAQPAAAQPQRSPRDDAPDYRSERKPFWSRLTERRAAQRDDDDDDTPRDANGNVQLGDFWNRR